MSEPTTRRSPVKPTRTRFVRVLATYAADHVLAEIEERGPRSCTADRYAVWAIPSDYGRAFRVVKVGDEEASYYAVNVGGEGEPATCECKGHLQHGDRTVCRHIACLRALIASGKLS
jgi:hypothetical protein